MRTRVASKLLSEKIIFIENNLSVTPLDLSFGCGQDLRRESRADPGEWRRDQDRDVWAVEKEYHNCLIER
jgi:hypothetical protein